MCLVLHTKCLLLTYVQTFNLHHSLFIPISFCFAFFFVPVVPVSIWLTRGSDRKKKLSEPKTRQKQNILWQRIVNSSFFFVARMCIVVVFVCKNATTLKIEPTRNRTATNKFYSLPIWTVTLNIFRLWKRFLNSHASSCARNTQRSTRDRERGREEEKENSHALLSVSFINYS